MENRGLDTPELKYNIVGYQMLKGVPTTDHF
jgi:hypothetical protein